MDNDVRFEYSVQRWLSVDEDDGDVVREMMPIGSETRGKIPNSSVYYVTKTTILSDWINKRYFHYSMFEMRK